MTAGKSMWACLARKSQLCANLERLGAAITDVRDDSRENVKTGTLVVPPTDKRYYGVR